MKRTLLLTFASSTLVMHFILPYAAMAEHHALAEHKNTHSPPNHTKNCHIKPYQDDCKKTKEEPVLMEELPPHIEVEPNINDLEEQDELAFVFFNTNNLFCRGRSVQMRQQLEKLKPAYHLENFIDFQSGILLRV